MTSTADAGAELAIIGVVGLLGLHLFHPYLLSWAVRSETRPPFLH
jgi:hypothetical protein